MGMSTNQVLMLLGIVIIGGGIVAVGTGQFNLSTTGGPQQSVDDDGTADLQFKANNELASSQPSYVNASYYVYNEDGVEVASGTTDTSSGFTTVSGLNEFESYRVIVQDDDDSGSDYYYAEKTVEMGETKETVIMDMDKEGTVSLSVKEDSGTDDDGTITLNAGQTDTVTLEIEENTQNAAFNNPAVFVKTNDTDAITDIEVNGAEVDVPDRISSYDDGYALGVSQIVDFSTEDAQVEITRDETNTDEATVTLLVADETYFQDDQAEWTLGFEDADEADVGAADVTTTVTVQ